MNRRAVKEKPQAPQQPAEGKQGPRVSGPSGIDDLIVWSLRALCLCFFVVGLCFLITPDWVIGRVDAVGSALGSFAPAPRSDQKLWLGLAVAYMGVICGIALVVSLDVDRYRPMLLVLAFGKAVSSLTALGFFIGRDVFIYLANFVVDGGLVAITIGLWVLAARLEPAAPG